MTAVLGSIRETGAATGQVCRGAHDSTRRRDRTYSRKGFDRRSSVFKSRDIVREAPVHGKDWPVRTNVTINATYHATTPDKRSAGCNAG